MTILLLLTCGICSGQVNLVPNPSFEITDTCNFNVGVGNCWGGIQAGNAPPWVGRSSDLYNSCSIDPQCGVPNNTTAYQNAHTGNGYAGEVVYGSMHYGREYMEVQLDSALIANRIYCASFYVNLSDIYALGSNNIGMRISVGSTYLWSTGYFLNYTPQINDTNIVSDTANWTLISGQYIATGGEDHITIGNFYPSSMTDTSASISPYWGLAYIYVDDVSVIDCTPGLGINEKNDIGTANIFPNPIANKLNVQTNNYEQAEIILYDLSSRKLLQQTFTNTTTINTEQLAKGMYLYEVRNRNGIIKNGKVIIE